jgi:hypothetical protein
MKGRFYGFCKDFSGRRHQLPDNIVEKLQVTKYKPPPKKKTQEKHKEDVKGDLETYIKKYMVKDDSFEIHRIDSLKGKKKSVSTNHVCPGCSTLSTFSITKDEIQKMCKCSNRKHRLIDKILSKL